MRRLLNGETVDHQGRFYTMTNAKIAPLPIQSHLPILVGGSGPKKTLRTTAQRADAWNTSGTIDEVRPRLAILDEHCADVGRDRSEIELTVSFPLVIRDDASDAEQAFEALLAANGSESSGASQVLLGPPSLIADGLRPFRDLGFETLIARLPAPHDAETIERIGEVRALLDGG
jgi:alkanesulfonate monooxygenase SsuD/methylene tetrahydromethanopterin reductase-like flavin-dependent oxidoreductase (luciferase family)